MTIQSELVFTGRELRDGGIIVAANNANFHFHGWSNMAFEALKCYLRQNKTPFMCENVRKYAADILELPNPPHSRAWGAIFQRAAKENLIRKVGYGQVENPKAHCCYATLWAVA